MADHDPDDYEVGYRRPPRHTQFRPGRSGNPRGRPRGSRGLKTDLHAELESKLTIQINGQPFTGTKQQLMLKALATRAAAGDVKAASIVLPLILQVLGIEDRGTDRQQLSAQDQALLDQLLAEQPEPVPAAGGSTAGNLAGEVDDAEA